MSRRDELAAAAAAAHDPATTPAPKPKRSRVRRVARWAGVAAALGIVALAALLFWGLATTGGRDSLLFRVVGLLPPGALSWERAEGVLRGPLVLHGVHYHHDGVDFRAERVLLDPDLLPVLGRRLQLDRLDVHGAVLTLPPAADEPFALPAWPESLPRLPMPIDLRATVVTIDGFRIARDDTTLIDIRRADGARLHFVDEGLVVESLAIDSDRGQATLRGGYRPARDFRSTLAATLALPAPEGGTPATLALDATGDLRKLRVALTGNAPEPLSVVLALEGDPDAPTWTLEASSEGLQPALFDFGGGDGVATADGGAAAGDDTVPATADDTPTADATAAASDRNAPFDPTTWTFDLQARGTGGDATLQGDVAQGDFAVRVEPSALSLADGQLQAKPLQLQLPQGPLRIDGTLQVEGDDATFDALLASTGLRIESDGAPPVDARGELRVAGVVDAWTVEGDATLERAGDTATVRVQGEGDRDGLRLDELHARTPTGTLDGRGDVAWSPALRFGVDATLAGFDPGYFLPDYPGAIDGALVARGAQDDAGRWQGEATLTGLRGTLRDRPVAGRAQADWRGDRGDADVDLRIGESHVQAKGGFGARYDLQATFAPLRLPDLLPSAQGRVEGTLALRGTAQALDVTADLQANDVVWDDQRAGTLRLQGTLPARGDAGRFQAQGEALQLGGVTLDALDVAGSGSQQALRLQGNAAGPMGAATFSGEATRRGDDWRGRLAALRLVPAQGPVLALEAPAVFAYGPRTLQLERSCLRAEEIGGRVCAAATGDRLDIDGDGLPLALVQPWLPTDTAVSMQAFGELDLAARIQRARDGRWSGEATLASAEGGLRIDEDLDRDVFAYRDLALRATLAADVLDATLQATLADDGRVAASVRTGLDAASALQGELQLDVRDLTWLELFSEDVAGPVGRLQGTLAISGTRAQPLFSGDASLADFAAELPGLGVKLRDGDVRLRGDADGQVRVEGQVRSGDGLLQLGGRLDFLDASAPLELTLKGERVTLASTAELYMVGDPDLSLRWLQDKLEVRGSLAVDDARVDLEALDGSVSVSPDVVVVDPLDGPRERGRPLDLDFRVTLGDEVKLKGFGLDGRMAGTVVLRQRPGRVAVASGNLDVTGKYRAYGQALDIQHARLGFANSPYDDPSLDILAEREFQDVTVGVRVRGTARRPQTDVVSTPAMETSEALSYLVFGRPLNTTTGNESQQLGAAALALGAGGNLVAQQLGAQLGLDEAGVTDSRNLGGATFTVGKYVSPRLFLSYGVSLIGTGQVVTLKYLLTRGFDISIESGNESAASINWRYEK